MALDPTAAVIDASAALAWLRQERGGEAVSDWLPAGSMSAVNFAEVAQRFWRGGEDPSPFLDLLLGRGLTVVSFDMEMARRAGDLERTTKPFGLSLADRCCVALAERLQQPVLTADRPFDRLGLSLEVHLLR